MSSTGGHVSAEDLRGGRGWLTSRRVGIGIAVIVVAVLGFGLLGDGLRDALDARMRSRE